MGSNRSRLITVGVVAVGAIAIFLAAQWWQSGPNETRKNSGTFTERINTAPADPVQEEPELDSKSEKKAAIDTRLHGQLASMPRISLDEYQTASEALQSIAAWSEMSGRDVQLNTGRWKKACMAVRTPTGRLPPMLETESYRSVLEKFESFCSGIENFEAANAPRVESAADVDEIFDRIEKAMATRPEPWPEKIERLGREGALEVAFEPLRNAIRNFDELKTQAAIFNLIGSGLYPQIEETGPRSKWFLDGLSFPLANALLCQRLDGCRGPAHPFVVKYCLMEYQNRYRVCDFPNSIEDAIYQTLTPVEFENYLQLYGWFTTQLARLGD
jgi:hypothetical protein